MKTLQNFNVRFNARAGVLALAVSALCQTYANASTFDNELETVVVTASRSEQSLRNVTADMTVLTKEAIERSGAVGIADLLAQTPSIQVSRYGGPGQVTSLYIRGASNQHAAVFIDGVRFDSQEASGGASWESIPLSQIERIEILRGSAAAIYGSDAMAGVVHVFTRKGKAGLQTYAEVGLGTYQTSKVAAGVSGANDTLNYAFSFADERADGYNVQPNSSTASTDKDGYSSSSINAKMGVKVDAHRIDATVFHNRLKADYDSWGGMDVADVDAKDLTTASLKWRAEWSDIYQSVVQVSRSNADIERRPGSEKVKTEITNYLLQNQWRLGGNRIHVDLERREDSFDANYAWPMPVDETRVQNSVAAGYQLIQGVHQIDLNVRYDDIKDLQSKTSGGLGYGLQLTDAWRWVASAGTAFRVPTLYQTHTGQTQAPLKSETSTNFETGIHYEVEGLKLSAVGYRNRFSDLIIYEWNGINPCNCFKNLDRVEYRGLVFSGNMALNQLNLSGSLDLQNPKDLTTQKRVPNRSKQMLKLSADTQVQAWKVGAETQLYSHRFTDSANTNALPGYGTANLFVSRKLTPEWTVLARINNIGDKNYEMVQGYTTPGRNVFFSLKWAPAI